MFTPIVTTPEIFTLTEFPEFGTKYLIIDINQSLSVIKVTIYIYLWQNFTANFHLTFHAPIISVADTANVTILTWTDSQFHYLINF